MLYERSIMRMIANDEGTMMTNGNEPTVQRDDDRSTTEARVWIKPEITSYVPLAETAGAGHRTGEGLSNVS